MTDITIPPGAIRFTLGEYAAQAINQELRDSYVALSQGAETGGWLFGEQDVPWWRQEGLEITFASGPGPNAMRAVGALNLDTDWLDEFDAVMRHEGYEHIGFWHTHPRGDDQPSEEDEQRISALLYEREHRWGCRTLRALELILTPAKNGGWTIHPWVFHRRKKAGLARPAGVPAPAEPAFLWEAK